MKTIERMAASLLLICAMLQAQIGQRQIDVPILPPPQSHNLSEYTFDMPSDPSKWTSQEPGLHAAFGSTDELYLRTQIPASSQMSGVWNGTGWQGERLNAQVLVWSPDSIAQVRLSISDLVSVRGRVIGRNHIKANMVRYVVSNFPYAARNFTCDVTLDSVYLMPDRFEPFERFDLGGKTIRPLWISIDIPASTAADDYHGVVEITSTAGSVTLKMNVTVQNLTLPNPRDWEFRLDLWQNPWVIARYYHVAPWSEEHRVLLKHHLKAYADAGGKFITTYAVHSPWADNSYMIEDTMIEWIKTADDSWTFDYTVFDQYVELAMEVGIEQAITLYTPLPWGNRFRYLDGTTGHYVYEEWAPDSDRYRAFWTIFLDNLKAHFTDKGWLEKSYLGINENPIELTLAAVKMIREHSPAWKITYAGNWHPELSPLIDDYSVVINSPPSAAEMQERAAKGSTTTFYVCCNPPQPNNFVFSPPAEGRFLGLYAAARGYDGFLRWAYDAWPADPIRDARHVLWPAGDCFLIYPSGNSCIRFEKLREGIADYEKIQILRKAAARSTDDNVIRLKRSLDHYLENLATQFDFSNTKASLPECARFVVKGKTMIDSLSEALMVSVNRQ